MVRDRENGRLLNHEDVKEFAAALSWTSSLDPEGKKRLLEGTAATVEEFSMRRCSSRALSLYESLLHSSKPKEIESSLWTSTRKLIEKEWRIIETFFHAVGRTMQSTQLNGPI